MSAFIVSTDHINLIATAVDHYRTSRHGRLRVMVEDRNARFGMRDALADLSVDDIGRLLLDANSTAFLTRYDHVIDADERAEITRDVDTYRYQAVPVMPAGDVPFPMLVLAATASYRYQACEDPNYDHTMAAKIINALREVAIDDLPGYGDATRIAWSFTCEKAAAAAGAVR